MDQGQRVRVIASVYSPTDDPLLGSVGVLMRPVQFRQRPGAWLVQFDDGRRAAVFECELEEVTRESEMARRRGLSGGSVEIDAEPEVKRGRGRPRKTAKQE